MIYKLVNIKTIIQSIITDLGISNEEIPWQDFVQWIARGLEHIGTYSQLHLKEEEIEIEDYRGKLPCDLYKVKRILNGWYFDKYNDSLMGDKEDITEKQNQVNKTSFTNYDYRVNLDTITCSYRSGTLTIQYLAFPVDEQGLPLVPDNVSFTEALFWKVAYQLAIRGYAFKNPQMRDINFCKQKWNFYCLQARAEANMPDPELANRLANNFIKLIPSRNEWNNMFSTLGDKENINLNGKS